MKIGSNGFINASQQALNNAMMTDQDGAKVGKGDDSLGARDAFLLSSDEVIENASLAANVNDAMAAIDDTNKTDDTEPEDLDDLETETGEEEPAADVVQTAADSIAEAAGDDLNNLQIAIKAIEDSMAGGTLESNQVKSEVIKMLQEIMANLDVTQESEVEIVEGDGNTGA